MTTAVYASIACAEGARGQTDPTTGPDTADVLVFNRYHPLYRGGQAQDAPKRSDAVNFLKSTLLTGLFVLLPLMLLWIGVKEIGGLLTEMATPIAGLFPAGTFDRLTAAPGFIALILIVGASLVIGLAARVPFIRGAGGHIEASILNKVPMYRMLKVISSSLIDSDAGDVRPALIRDGSGGGDPCYVIEKLNDGRATVLLPWSPASFAGSIKVVQQSELEYLSCSLDEFSRSISQIGVGLSDCVARQPGAANAAPKPGTSNATTGD